MTVASNEDKRLPVRFTIATVMFIKPLPILQLNSMRTIGRQILANMMLNQMILLLELKNQHHKIKPKSLVGIVVLL